MIVSLIGAIGVIIGLYTVLWGKAEDVAEVKEKTDPKLMIINETEEGNLFINESCEKTYYETVLEEPLLPA